MGQGGITPRDAVPGYTSAHRRGPVGCLFLSEAVAAPVRSIRGSSAVLHRMAPSYRDTVY